MGQENYTCMMFMHTNKIGINSLNSYADLAINIHPCLVFNSSLKLWLLLLFTTLK